MEILNPNCSEAIFRIKIDGLTEEEKQSLRDVLEKIEKENSEWWSETNWCEKTIFGTDMIEIDGEAPRHSMDELEERLGTLKFWDKVETEEEDY